MELLWLKHDGKTRCFPIAGGKLPVSGVAHQFRLDPGCICIGQEHALLSDASGNSLVNVEQIRLIAAQEQLGDGRSKEQAIAVSGENPQVEDHTWMKREMDEYWSLMRRAIQKQGQEQRTARMEAEEEEKAMLRKAEEQRDKVRRAIEKRKRRSEEKYSAMRMSLYEGTGAIYSYCPKLTQVRLFGNRDEFRELYQESLKKFVGTVHRSHPVSRNLLGFATLVKPDGTCFTSYRLVEGLTKCVVRFPHLAESLVMYECSVEQMGELAILRPKHKLLGFGSCMLMFNNQAGPTGSSANLFTFSFIIDPLEHKQFSMEELSNFQLVCMYSVSEHLHSIALACMPETSVYGLGGPVMSVKGGWVGCVVEKRYLEVNKNQESSWWSVVNEYESLGEPEMSAKSLLNIQKPGTRIHHVFKTSINTGELLYLANTYFHGGNEQFISPHDEFENNWEDSESEVEVETSKRERIDPETESEEM